MIIILAILLSYLLGSIPFGLIIASAHRIDLRSIGSGNIGATNVARALGRKWGCLCFGLDVLKGLAPTLMTLIWVKPEMLRSGSSETVFLWVWLCTGCAAILGHVFPIYIGFKGGKAVSTSFGVALGLWPYFTGCAVLAFFTWILMVRVSRYVSLASVVAGILFPVYFLVAVLLTADWKLKTLWPLQAIAILIPLMVTLRHRDNLKRILTGTENKVAEKTS